MENITGNTPRACPGGTNPNPTVFINSRCASRPRPPANLKKYQADPNVLEGFRSPNPHDWLKGT